MCSLLRAEASRDASPEATLHMLNRHLLARSGRGMFATAIYGVFSRSRRELSYVRAGHELPLAWDAEGRALAIREERGQPLGLFAEPFLDVQRLSLPVGATLLLFTDGITEASDGADMLFGDERLRELALAQPNRPAQTLCDEIVAAVRRHQGEAPQADDLTLLALRVL